MTRSIKKIHYFRIGSFKINQSILVTWKISNPATLKTKLEIHILSVDSICTIFQYRDLYQLKYLLKTKIITVRLVRPALNRDLVFS